MASMINSASTHLEFSDRIIQAPDGVIDEMLVSKETYSEAFYQRELNLSVFSTNHGPIEYFFTKVNESNTLSQDKKTFILKGAIAAHPPSFQPLWDCQNFSEKTTTNLQKIALKLSENNFALDFQRDLMKTTFNFSSHQHHISLNLLSHTKRLFITLQKAM